MIIILENKKMKTFAEVEVGDAFCFDEKIYMKITHSEYDKDTEYNAVNMSSGILDEFDDRIEVQEVKTLLTRIMNRLTTSPIKS